MLAIIYIRFVLGIILILASLSFFIIQILGVFKMNYVLNRMHLAAIGDALALGLAFLGLILLSGMNLTSLKLFIIPCFMFVSSPVSSHLIAQMEVETGNNKDRFRQVSVEELDEKGEDD